MTQIQAGFLQDPGLQQILAMLEQGGHQALIVGGAVRNALLGQPVADVDLSSDALPERVLELATARGLRVIPTGLSHGTVTVLAPGGTPFEITTFRQDLATDGRHAEVAFCGDIIQDARRRDFTMNALYARADGTVLDPLGELPDLLARRLRFVGDPDARIAEDYLRILRFFRFHAWYGAKGQADPAALRACRAKADGLARLSKERIGAEVMKLLAAPDPADALQLMEDSGVLNRILPGAGTGLIARLLAITPEPPDPLLRLAALGADDARSALRLDNRASKELSVLSCLMAAKPDLPRAAYQHGVQTAMRLGWLLKARGETLPQDWSYQIERAAGMKLPLLAADLIPKVTGPALGQALKLAEDHWIDSGFTARRDELRDVALGVTS